LISLIGYNYLLPTFDKYQNKQIELSNVELQLMNFENKKVKYEANI
jgi:hypothetical protein